MQISEFAKWASVTRSRRSFIENPPADGPFAKWSFAEQSAWDRYQRWRNAELVMRNSEKDGSPPTVAFDRSVNLKSVETVGLTDMRTVQRQPSMRERGLWTERPETIRFFATGLLDETSTISYPWPRGGVPVVSSTHLYTMLTGLRSSGKNFTKLTLHRVQELSAFRHTEPESMVPSLKHLVLDTSTIYHVPTEEDKRLARGAAKWILGLQHLEVLEMRQNPRADINPDLCMLLAPANWPKLLRMDLSYLDTSGENLWNFVLKHVEKLSVLIISEPDVGGEDWATFKQEAKNWEDRYGRLRLQLSEKPEKLQLIEDDRYSDVVW